MTENKIRCDFLEIPLLGEFYMQTGHKFVLYVKVSDLQYSVKGQERVWKTNGKNICWVEKN